MNEKAENKILLKMLRKRFKKETKSVNFLVE